VGMEIGRIDGGFGGKLGFGGLTGCGVETWGLPHLRIEMWGTRL
jgi:hypothetical protein